MQTHIRKITICLVFMISDLAWPFTLNVGQGHSQLCQTREQVSWLHPWLKNILDMDNNLEKYKRHKDIITEFMIKIISEA